VKILLLTLVLPYPPDSGPKVKTYNMVKYISQAHDLTLVSFVRGDQTAEIEHLKQFCHAIYPIPIQRSRIKDGLALFKSMVSPTPWVIARDDRESMRGLISTLIKREKFDLIHADQLNMAQFAPAVPGIARILDDHNAVWLLYQRMAQTAANPGIRLFLEREWRMLKDYEGRICREFDAVLTVSDEDKQSLVQAMGQDGNLIVAPIAVDTEELKPVQRDLQHTTILHIGTMFWPTNVDGILWFLREVYPIIQREKPDVCFNIIGARPPKKVIQASHDLAGVTVTGYVKDPGEYIRKTGVMVVPLRAGGGMRVKILEAMAKGLPIVSTSIGCEGIAVENGRHLLIADTPEDFAQATLRLLKDLDLSAFLSKNGRELIEKTYDYRQAYRPVGQAYESVTTRMPVYEA